MEIENRYHLDEYLIIEHPDARLEWVEHFGLGMQRSGTCYVNGNILFIGNWQNQDAGFLMLEYTEKLHKLPEWRKTRFICPIGSILDTATGKRANEKTIENFLKTFPVVFVKQTTHNGQEKGTFRLWGYRLTVNHEEDIRWEKYGGASRIYGGKGQIESGVLFLGPWSHQVRRQTRKKYFDELGQLPRWTGTKFWCKNRL